MVWDHNIGINIEATKGLGVYFSTELQIKMYKNLTLENVSKAQVRVRRLAYSKDIAHGL